LIHVEFLGIPGAGKSTLAARALAGRLGSRSRPLALDEAVRRSLRAEMRDRLLRPVVRLAPRRVATAAILRSADRGAAMRAFLLAHPELGEVLLRALRRRAGTDPDLDLALGWVLDLFASFELARRVADDQVLVLDEGFASRALTLFAYRFSAADEADLAAYVGAIPRPDLVLVLEVPAAICAARLDRRGWPRRFAGLSPSERRRFLEDAERCCRATAALLAARGVRVHRVETHGATSRAAAEVARILVGVLDGRVSRAPRTPSRRRSSP
jgi:thymidylate kinase